MKRSVVLDKHRETIIAAMRKYYERMLQEEGRLQYVIFITEDGRIYTLEDIAGGTSSLDADDLLYVTTIHKKNPVWGCIDTPVPEDEDEREDLKQGIIECMMDDYDPEWKLDEIILLLEMANE